MCFELDFGSLATYSPRGPSPISVTSRIFRDNVKAGNDTLLARAAAIIRNHEYGSEILHNLINESCVLVPVPRSSLQVQGGLWPSLKIAEALKSAGLARQVEPYLQRIRVIPKSSFQARGERPSLEVHIDSLAVQLNAQCLLPIEITLIDDFITKGTTIYASAQKIKEFFPNATIRAFALVRTMGLVGDVRAIIDPCLGTIRYNGSDTIRSHSYYD